MCASLRGGWCACRLKTHSQQRTHTKQKTNSHADGPPAAYPPPPPDYSVLGQGYNVLTALPLSVGMSSLDPGLT